MAKQANIDKERARKVYNYYAQIETTESIIADLEEFISKWNEGKAPDVIPENYHPYGSIEISIPYFEAGKFKQGGARVFNISYPAALKVLKSHIRGLRRNIKRELESIADEVITDSGKQKQKED